MTESDPDALGLLPAERRVPIPGDGPQDVASILDAPVARVPEREALVGRGVRLTFAALDREADRAARALAARGVGAGVPVAACLPNCAEIVVAFLATQRLGAIWVGINRVLAPPEQAFVLADSGAALLVAGPDVLETLAAQPDALPALRHRVDCVPGAADDGWRTLLAEAPPGPPLRPEVDPFAPAAIAYTSGTTGRPKGAVHSQHNLLLPGAVARATGKYPPHLRHGSVLPLTILNLMVLAPCVAFQLETACVCMDRIDPVGLAAWIRDERVGHFAGVPTILHDLLTHPEVSPNDLATLHGPEVGGADCPPAFLSLYRERFGTGVGIGYGLTEAPTAVVRTHPDDPPEAGLCGRAEPQVEIRILDEAGRALPPGETGEICVAPRGEGPWAGVWTPMLGYWRRPEATREALAGGVLHTSDLGYLDADGRLFIRGRRKELILRGGANVYPPEVERVLQGHPDVAGAAVLGVPDARLGERVVAAVQLAPGAAADAGALRAHCAAALARYKVPEQWVFVDSLPRNAMNKVVKAELRPRFTEGRPPVGGTTAFAREEGAS